MKILVLCLFLSEKSHSCKIIENAIAMKLTVFQRMCLVRLKSINIFKIEFKGKLKQN